MSRAALVVGGFSTLLAFAAGSRLGPMGHLALTFDGSARGRALAALDAAATDAQRVDAIAWVGRDGDERDVALLETFVGSHSSRVMSAAVDAIGCVGGTRATDDLLSWADASDRPLVDAAITGLGADRDPRALIALEKRLQKRRNLDVVGDALARNGSTGAAQALVAAFDHASTADVGEIATALASFSSDVPEARQALYGALDDHRTDRRAAALSALTAAGDKDLVPRLEDTIHHGDGEIRGEVASALGNLRDPRGVALLAEIIDIGPPSARNVAIAAMQEVGGPTAESALENLVMTAPTDIACTAAGAVDDPALDPGVEQVLLRAVDERPVSIRNTAIGRLLSATWARGEVPPAVLDLARDALETGDSSNANAAVTLLLRDGTPADALRIQAAVEDAPSSVRVEIVSALATATVPWAHATLLELLDDSDSSVVEAAITACFEGDDDLRTHLEARLVDLAERGDGPTGAIDGGLARLGTPRAIDALFDQIEAGTSNEANVALDALAADADPTVLHRLLADADRAQPELRAEIYARVLERSDVADKKLVDSLIGDSDPNVNDEAIAALGRLGTRQSRAELADLAAKGTNDERINALEALSEAGGPEAEAAAKAALSDPTLAPTALQTLGAVGTRSSRAVVVDTIAHGETAETRSAAISTAAGDPTAEPAIVTALGDPDPAVRSAAISGLASFGNTAAADALGGVLDHATDPDELAEAASNLAAIGGPIARAHQQQIDALQPPEPTGDEELEAIDVEPPSAPPPGILADLPTPANDDEREPDDAPDDADDSGG